MDMDAAEADGGGGGSKKSADDRRSTYLAGGMYSVHILKLRACEVRWEWEWEWGFPRGSDMLVNYEVW